MYEYTQSASSIAREPEFLRNYIDNLNIRLKTLLSVKHRLEECNNRIFSTLDEKSNKPELLPKTENDYKYELDRTLNNFDEYLVSIEDNLIKIEEFI